MWTEFSIKMNFLNRLMGGTPADPEIQRKMLEARMPKNRPPESRSIDEIAEEVLASTVDVALEDEAPSLNIFQRDPETGFLSVGMRTIRGHIKNVSTVLSSLYAIKVKGEKSFGVRAKNSIYYPPHIYWIPILDEGGKPMIKPDGIREKPIHFMTRMGQRSAIKVMEFVNRPSLEFELWILTSPGGKPSISQKDLETIFTYGSVHGYGPERGDGEGKYSFDVSLKEG